jgi:MFS family permease
MRIHPNHVNPSLLAIIAEGFLTRLSFGVISFALPLYARHLGMSFTEIGLLFSLNALIEQAMKPLAGRAADRFGLKRSFTLAIAIRSLIALLLVFASSPLHLYAIRSLHGLSESLRDPSVNALIANNGRHATIASSFAWYSTAKTVAGSLGKAATGIILALTAYNYSGAFLIAFFLSFLPLYFVARFVRDTAVFESAEVDGEGGTQQPGPDAGSPGLPRGDSLKELFPFVTLGFLIASTAHMLHNLFPVLALEYAGLDAAQTSIIYALAIPFVLITGPLFGWVSDNVSRKLVLMVRGFSNIFSSIIYVVFPTFLGIAVGKIADDVGKAAFRPAWGALMSYVSSFDRRSRARTMGYLSFGEGAGEIAGPILAGLLWGLWGLPAVLLVRIILALASEVYATSLTGSLEKEWYASTEGEVAGRPLEK